MKKVKLQEAHESLAEHVGRLGDEPVVVMKGRKPIAVLVAIRDMDWETFSLGTSPDFMAIIERSRARQKTMGSVSHDEMMRELGLTQADLDQAGVIPLNGETRPKPPRPRSRKQATG
jgi:hypothetical protein